MYWHSFDGPSRGNRVQTAKKVVQDTEDITTEYLFLEQPSKFSLRVNATT